MEGLVPPTLPICIIIKNEKMEIIEMKNELDIRAMLGDLQMEWNEVIGNDSEDAQKAILMLGAGIQMLEWVLDGKQPKFLDTVKKVTE